VAGVAEKKCGQRFFLLLAGRTSQVSQTKQTSEASPILFFEDFSSSIAKQQTIKNFFMSPYSPTMNQQRLFFTDYPTMAGLLDTNMTSPSPSSSESLNAETGSSPLAASLDRLTGLTFSFSLGSGSALTIGLLVTCE
jgi:hypothetical protein